jgi:transcription elongation factor GreA
MNEPIYITQEGLDNLIKEFKELTEVKRLEVGERIRIARDQGDVSENAEYAAAKEEQVSLESRINELDSIIKRAQVVKEEKGKVNIGSLVTVHVEGDNEDYHIVGEPEADPLNRKISHKSPLGTLLVGKKINDTFDLETAVGKVTYRIVEIK